MASQLAPGLTEGTLGEQLFCLLKEYGQCDLLLDRELSDPLHEEVARLAAAQLPVLRINPKKAALPLDQCLMLARLTTKQLPLLDLSADIGLRQNTDPTQSIRSIGGWLFSRDAPPEKVAKWVESALVASVQRGANILLRLWDPRVIGHLPRILTAEQLSWVMGPVACWAWINRAGRLQVLRKPQVQLDGTVLLPLRLSPAQDDALDRIEHINVLLKTLFKLGHAIDPARDAELDELLLLAQCKGHTHVPDLLAYALHALLIHKDFDTWPDVSDAISRARAQGLGLCAALEPFDDAYWAANALPT